MYRNFSGVYIYIYHSKPMGIGGFEPPTLRLSSVYSNQLSYIPIIVINLFMHKS